MRLRLFGLLLTLISLLVVALLVPLAVNYAATTQQRVLIDRIDDTNQFAALARSGMAGSGMNGTDGLDALAAEIRRYDTVYDIPTVVLDRHRRVLVESRPVDLEQPEIQERIDVALSGRRAQEAVALWPWRDSPLVVAVPFNLGEDAGVAGVVVTISPTGHLRETVTRTWGFFAAIGALALMVFAGVAGTLARWVLRPVSSLDAAAHAIALGDLTSRAPESSGPPELRRLARSFNEMAATVSASLEQQRRFVAEASHQMRNPLTALLLRLGNLAEDADPGAGLASDRDAGRDSDRAELAAALHEGRRLQRILDELLALARAERHLGAVRAQDVGAVLDERLSSWRIRVELRDQILVREGVTEAVAVVDAESLGRAIDEVLDNATRYAGDGGVIIADLQSVPADQPDGPAVRLTLSDDGDGLPAADLERISDPFWRGKVHANIPGTGLGMSIVATVLQTFGARLEFAAAPAGGLAVTFVLPAPEPDPGPNDDERPPVTAPGPDSGHASVSAGGGGGGGADGGGGTGEGPDRGQGFTER